MCVDIRNRNKMCVSDRISMKQNYNRMHSGSFESKVCPTKNSRYMRKRKKKKSLIMFVSNFFPLLLLVALTYSFCLVSAQPKISPLDPDGAGYTLNFTAFFDYPESSADQPSFTKNDVRTAVFTVEFEVTRSLAVFDKSGQFSHNQITTLSMAIKNSTTDFVDDMATAGLQYAQTKKYLTVQATDSKHVKITNDETENKATIWVQFVVPVVKYNAAEDDIYWASEYLHVIASGLPPAANFSKLNSITFQFQKMQLKSVMKSPTNRNFFASQQACTNAYPGHDAFLATFLKSDENSFLSNSGAQTSMDASNTLKYWIGASVFDNKNEDRNLCWTEDSFYNQELCNTSAYPSSAFNGSIYSYASAPKSWQRNELFCSRPSGFDCYQSTVNSRNSLTSGTPISSTTTSWKTYGVAYVYESATFTWKLNTYEANPSSGVSNFGAICVNLTAIGSFGPHFYTPESIEVKSVNIVPPATLTLTPSRTKTVSLSQSDQDPSHTNSMEPTLSESQFTASFTFSKTRTPPPTKTSTRSFSKLLSESSSLEETLSATPSHPLTVSDTQATISSSPTVPTLEITSSLSASASRFTKSSSMPVTQSRTLDETFSASQSLSAQTPSYEFVTVRPLNTSLFATYLSVGPSFVGFSRGDPNYEQMQTQAGSTITNGDRPIQQRSFFYEISNHADDIVFGSSCSFSEQVFETSSESSSDSLLLSLNGWFTNIDTTISKSETQLEFRKAASKWIFDRLSVQVISPRKIQVTLPIIPDWKEVKNLFGPTAGDYVLELQNFLYEPIQVEARISTTCFSKSVAEPTPTVRFGILPPHSKPEPILKLAESSQYTARGLSFALSSLGFFPQAAAMHISRTSFALHMAQCVAIGNDNPLVLEYPFRFPISIGSIDSTKLYYSSLRLKSGVKDIENDDEVNQVIRKENTDHRIISQYIGACVGNLLFLIAVMLIGYVSCRVYSSRKNIPLQVAYSELRYPSLWLVVPLFLILNVIARSASFVIFQGASAGQKVVGILVTALWILFVVVFLALIRTKVKRLAKMVLITDRFAKASERKRKLIFAVWGEYKWSDMLKSDKIDESGGGEYVAFTGASIMPEIQGEEENINDNNNNDESENEENEDSTNFSSSLRQTKTSLSSSEDALDPGFVRRYGRFFRLYLKQHVWFSVLDLFMIAFVGFLSGIRFSEKACIISSLTYTVACALYLAGILLRRPLLSKLEFYFTVIMSMVQVAIGGVLTYSLMQNQVEPVKSYQMRLDAVKISENLLFVLGGKIVLDGGLFFLQRSLRKERLAEEEEENAKNNGNDDDNNNNPPMIVDEGMVDDVDPNNNNKNQRRRNVSFFADLENIDLNELEIADTADTTTNFHQNNNNNDNNDDEIQIQFDDDNDDTKNQGNDDFFSKIEENMARHDQEQQEQQERIERARKQREQEERLKAEAAERKRKEEETFVVPRQTIREFKKEQAELERRQQEQFARENHNDYRPERGIGGGGGRKSNNNKKNGNEGKSASLLYRNNVEL